MTPREILLLLEFAAHDGDGEAAAFLQSFAPWVKDHERALGRTAVRRMPANGSRSIH